jgi:hypothetical protein
MKNLFALSLVFSLSFAPLAIAQEVPAVDASAVPAETAPVTEAAPVPEPVSDSQGGDASLAVPVVADENPAPLPEVQPEVLVQDTTNTQDTVTADVLQGTEDPVELATSTIAIEPLATTTGDIIIPTEEQPEPTPIEEEIVLDVVAEDVVVDVPVEEVAIEPLTAAPALSEEDLAPKPEYTFAMTGKKLATQRTVKTPDGKEHIEAVAAAVTPEIDNTTGTMRIGGACDDTYFVVLLFRNQDDYARDPRSYILNKAFPCENKSFSYDIAELPSSLSNGTYYLLVGSQGERGAWTPITGLTEITINRTQ